MIDITVKTRNGMLVSYERNTEAAKKWRGCYIATNDSLIGFAEINPFPDIDEFNPEDVDVKQWNKLGLTHEVIELSN